jgi:HD-GYP domain-containing protein (c-di-GMP phosphodiesterase class II)
MPTFQKWFMFVFRVRSRRGLLVTILALQALVLSIGLGIVFQDVRHQVAMSLQDRILDQNVRTAESLAKTMDDLNFGEAVCGSVGCERAQRLIEELKLPAGGFVCLLNDQDKIICHPGLKTNPGLCGTDLKSMEVEATDGKLIPLGEADRKGTVAGHAKFLDHGTHYLAAKYIPSMKARIVVQQPESGLLALGAAVASGSMLRAAGLGALALAMTGGISFVLIRRHNLALEAINRGLETEVTKRVRESLSARHSLIIGLAKLAESRDTDTGDHLERICSYSDLLARELRGTHAEITELWLENLKLAASLHDIGKVGIPDTVLLKPGKLTAEERTVMEQHPRIGAETLQTVRERLGNDELLDMSLQVAASHHERWDGTGYPGKLSGVQIPLAARIVALADVYDALTSVRVYKAAMSHAEASEIICSGKGTHFDPAIVDAFVRVEDVFASVREKLNPKGGMEGEPAGRIGGAAGEIRRAA